MSTLCRGGVHPARSIIPLKRLSEKRVNELESMPYDEYLKSDEWQAIRKYMRKMYPTCQICGYKENLAVHHSHYIKRGRETIRDLTVLCKTCHSKAHDKYRQGNYIALNDISSVIDKYVDQNKKGALDIKRLSDINNVLSDVLRVFMALLRSARDEGEP